MKKQIIFALFLLFSMGVLAQESALSETQPLPKRFECTFSIGYGTTASSEPYDKPIVNFNAGIDFKLNLKSLSEEKVKIYGLTGLQFTQRGGKISTNINAWLKSGNSFRISQLNIPLHVGVKYVLKNNWRIFADFGPFFAANLSDNLSEGFGDNDYKLESKSMDFGIGFNMGICFKKFGISVGLDKGLVDIAEITSKDEDISANLKSSGFYFKLQWTFNKQ